MWPPVIGLAPTLRFDSKVFETKTASENKNQYDGGDKGGESWKTLIRGYLLGRVPMMKWVLKWAEDFGNNFIDPTHIQSLRNYLDEDPDVLNHLLWAFLNINLTAKAREIFCNVPDSQGLEAWRRIHCHIYSKSERRVDELYQAIHHPKAAPNPQDVSAVLEEWDTNQRVYAELGGVPLRDDELRNIVLKIVPHIIRENLVFKMHDFYSWSQCKDYIKENARRLVVYGKPTSLNLADVAEKPAADVSNLDELPLEEAIEQLGKAADSPTILALVARRQNARAAKGREARQPARDGKPQQQKPAPMSAGGKPLCTNCGKEGHDKFSCRAERAEPGKQPCFKCGKVGHRSAQCPSGLPAKSLVPENVEDVTNLMLTSDEGWRRVESGNPSAVLTDDDKLCQLSQRSNLSGARHFCYEDSEDESTTGDDGISEELNGDDHLNGDAEDHTRDLPEMRRFRHREVAPPQESYRQFSKWALF